MSACSTFDPQFGEIDGHIRIDCSGIAGYSLFGRTVDSDILVSFPRDDTPIVVGRVAISFVAVGCIFCRDEEPDDVDDWT